MPIPTFKVEIESTDYTNDVTRVEVVRIENAVSIAKISLNDVQSKNYIDTIDLFDNLKVSFQNRGSSLTEVFDGTLEDVAPTLSTAGQMVLGTAYGLGRCLRNTNCNTSYGTASKNPTINTPGEIWDALRANYVNKSFGGAATGYALTVAYNNATSPTIEHLFNPYISNMDILNQTLLLIQGDRAGSTGHHWLVDTAGKLNVKRIGTDITGWTNWWDTDQATSTLVEGQDFISYGFSKRARTKDFANKIVLTTDLRKPGYDYWTEYRGAGGDSGKALWGTTDVTLTDENGAGLFKVGYYSIKCQGDEVGVGSMHYPSASNAAWDFTKCGSEHTFPSINFYVYQSRNLGVTFDLRLRTDVDDYYEINLQDALGGTQDEWFHLKFPIGPHYALAEDEARQFRWTEVDNGDVTWSEINDVWFQHPGTVVGGNFYIDDLHFAGKIIREAYNSTNITANKEVQKMIRMNTSVDDSLKQSDASGTAGLLAYGELLTSQITPVLGTITTALIETVMPGQKVHIHAGKQASGTYRIDSDFRVKQVTHILDTKLGAQTTLQLTDDVTHSFAHGLAELKSMYYQITFIDPEAKSLRATGIDPLIPHLAVDYP